MFGFPGVPKSTLGAPFSVKKSTFRAAAVVFLRSSGRHGRDLAPKMPRVHSFIDFGVVFGRFGQDFGPVWMDFHDFCSCEHDFNDYFIWIDSFVCFEFERFALSLCRNFNTRSFTYFPLFPFPFPIFKPSSFQLPIAD